MRPSTVTPLQAVQRELPLEATPGEELGSDGLRLETADFLGGAALWFSGVDELWDEGESRDWGHVYLNGLIYHPLSDPSWFFAPGREGCARWGSCTIGDRVAGKR